MRYLFLLLPTGLLSRLFGVFTRLRLPSFILWPATKVFCRLYPVNLAESEKPVGAYRSFDEFFTRGLKPGLRPLAGPPAVPAPVDGVLGERGAIHGGLLLQAKGMPYRLDELAGPELVARLEGGAYATFTLAPGDYHRVHAPVAGAVSRVIRFPGRLLPVNRALRGSPRLYTRNERVSVILETAFGPVVVVFVGAFNVGRIGLAFGPGCLARLPPGETRIEPPARLGAGDEIGRFHTGSTVILAFPPGVVALDPGGEERAVRMGERFASREKAP